MREFLGNGKCPKNMSHAQCSVGIRTDNNITAVHVVFGYRPIGEVINVDSFLFTHLKQTDWLDNTGSMRHQITYPATNNGPGFAKLGGKHLAVDAGSVVWFRRSIITQPPAQMSIIYNADHRSGPFGKECLGLSDAFGLQKRTGWLDRQKYVFRPGTHFFEER